MTKAEFAEATALGWPAERLRELHDLQLTMGSRITSIGALVIWTAPPSPRIGRFSFPLRNNDLDCLRAIHAQETA